MMKVLQFACADLMKLNFIYAIAIIIISRSLTLIHSTDEMIRCVSPTAQLLPAFYAFRSQHSSSSVIDRSDQVNRISSTMSSSRSNSIKDSSLVAESGRNRSGRGSSLLLPADENLQLFSKNRRSFSLASSDPLPDGQLASPSCRLQFDLCHFIDFDEQ